MKLKICGKCKLEKPIIEFNFRNKQKNKYVSSCKLCTRAETKSHYERNKPYYLAKARVFAKKSIEITRKFLFEYFQTHHCVDCGEKDIVVLQFDHVEGLKRQTIGWMMSQQYSLDTIKKEIEKCEVRCANCHVRRTAKNGNWWRNSW